MGYPCPGVKSEQAASVAPVDDPSDQLEKREGHNFINFMHKYVLRSTGFGYSVNNSC